MFQQEAESEGVQQPESGAVQPNVSPSSQQQAESGDVQIQPNVSPSSQQQAESGGVQEQPNATPSSQQQAESGGEIQPNISPSLQQPAESGGVQVLPNVSPSTQQQAESNLGGSAHQLTESEIEPEILSGGVQPNVNQQQFTEAQIAANYEIGTAEHLKYYQSLHNAAKIGDWESAISFIKKDRNALAARITVDSKTVFHVAALCDQWEFILKLLELVSFPESIAVQDNKGKTVLHYVALGGSLKTAKALVQKNASLPQIDDYRKDIPLLYATWSRNKKLVWYLSSLTSLDLSLDSIPLILRTLILSDIALDFVHRDPNLALAEDAFGESLLYWLATNPSNFFSGSNLGFLERWIYKSVHVERKYPSTHSDSVIVNVEDPALQPRSLRNPASSVNMVRDAKLKHECAVELVNYVCSQLSNMSFQEIENFLTNQNSNILNRAIKCGIKEIVRILLQQFPDLINVQVLPDRNILQAAIEYRQENIVNLIKQISTTTTKHLGSYAIESQGVTLHLAGWLAPASKLFSVSGAALQMQRELQWFKEAEEITFAYRKEWKNMENKTPKDVFRTAHTPLAEKGEKWMKDTAKSCMLVSTLIATVLFAAAFTVPGGNNNDNGIANFLHTKAFVIFAISDALGLFFSLTSLLMFLAILTARYELDDFLESLPKRLIIGLGSLFFAIAAMIIAFGASLTIVLGQRWNWGFVPITLVAYYSVAIFVELQLPLFIQMVRSTYGASIFHPWPSKKFE